MFAKVNLFVFLDCTHAFPEIRVAVNIAKSVAVIICKSTDGFVSKINLRSG
jgi:hypothetical protein